MPRKQQCDTIWYNQTKQKVELPHQKQRVQTEHTSKLDTDVACLMPRVKWPIYTNFAVKQATQLFSSSWGGSWVHDLFKSLTIQKLSLSNQNDTEFCEHEKCWCLSHAGNYDSLTCGSWLPTKSFHCQNSFGPCPSTVHVHPNDTILVLNRHNSQNPQRPSQAECSLQIRTCKANDWPQLPNSFTEGTDSSYGLGPFRPKQSVQMNGNFTPN
jgi:hypothetical protein